MPAMRELEETIRGTFHESADPEIELFPEYFDFARFPIEQFSKANAQYLRERYGHEQPDLIMVTTGFALDFVLSHRSELFPKAPVVFCAATDPEVIKSQIPSDVTGVVGHFDLERTIQLIFKLQPKLTEIVCVGGTSEFDRFWEEQTRKATEPYAGRMRFRWITDKSLHDTANELAKLPPSAAVFYISMLRDGAGHSMTATDAMRDLCRVSKAPVYGITEHFLDAGAVGGAVFDFGDNGRKAADLVLKVLRGEWVPAGSPELEIRNPVAVNWEALKKWNLSESRVPVGAEIRHKPPGLWETHRLAIIGGICLFIVQALLIAGLLANLIRRRRAEGFLAESERRFQTMADAAPVLIWMSGTDKLCTFFNKAWLRFTGRKMEQELGIGWAEGVHVDDYEQCLQIYETAFDAREPFTMRYRLRRRDGEYRFISDSGVPRYGMRGDFRGYIGTCVDITDVLQQEKALHESEERVTLAAEAAHLGVWERDLTNGSFWISDKTRELFQFDPSERVTYAMFRARAHPEDVASSDLARDEAIKKKGGYELEYRVLLPDGTVRWISGRARCMLDEKGKVTRLLGVSMDVTERKQAQELFQLATEASSSGVLLINGNGEIVLVNAQIEKLFNCWREELIGKSVDILIPDLFGGCPTQDLKLAIATAPGAAGSPRKVIARRKDGSEFPAEIGLNRIQTPSGVLVLAAVSDISEQKKAEEQERKLRDEMDRLSRISLLGEMTGSIAHELNQPLSGIMSNASAGQRFIDRGEVDAAELREILGDIAADGRRASDVIRHIRNTIKNGAALRERINMNDVIGRVAHMVQPDTVAHSCELELSLAKDLPVVEGDPIQIQQVLINLVTNACDAMDQIPVNQRKVKIATENGTGSVKVTVRDQGPGVSAQVREHLFDQFFTTKDDGLGMGLAIVRSIVEAHGGKIDLENLNGSGACFYFTLPITMVAKK